MGVEAVKADLARRAPDLVVMELAVSTATVAEAAAGHGVSPARIAKTLSLAVAGRPFLVVMSGTARLDNAKAKAAFGGKVSFLSGEEAERLTGHPPGGVCPFGLATPLPVYCDRSLEGFDEVIPAAGSVRAAVRIAPERLCALAGGTWVDVSREV